MSDPLALTQGEGQAGPVRSVYVHAPFCLRRCHYCDFAVTVCPPGRNEEWLFALEKELAVREGRGALEEELAGREGRAALELAPTLSTLFVGGGTPSLLGPAAMDGLARILGPGRLGDGELEWTAEANPESFTSEVARGWAGAGLNRLSLGAQSFQEGPLRWMGRAHGPEGSRGAVREARLAGIRNISLDLIFGLPEGVERDWRRDLDAALALGVPHLSLYGLSSEAGTPLGRAVEAGRTRMADEGRYRDEYLEASRRLTGEGFRHYEVSNFSLPGFEARHNRAYWSLQPYLGLGNSAHSYRHPVRSWNLRDWRAYQEAVEAGDDPVEGWEELTPGMARLETVWLGLRTDAGISRAGLPPGGVALGRGWEKRGLASVDEDAIRLTPEGWLLLDRLAVEFDGVLGPEESQGRGVSP